MLFCSLSSSAVRRHFVDTRIVGEQTAGSTMPAYAFGSSASGYLLSDDAVLEK